MRIEFEDDDLRRLYMESDFRTSGFGPELIRGYRKVLNFVAAANDERDLRAHQSLHFEKLKGNRPGQYSMRIFQQWRLVFYMRNDEEGQQLFVLEVVDYH